MADSLQRAAGVLAAGLSPITRAIGAPDAAVIGFVEGMGWTLPSVPPALRDLRTAVAELTDAHAELSLNVSIEASGGTVSIDVAAQYVALVQKVASVVSKIHSLPADLNAQLPASFLSATGFASEFPRRLVDLMLHHLIVQETKRLEPTLRLLGLIELAEMPADPAKFQPEFTRVTIHWDRFPKLFSDPAGLLRDAHGFGTPSFDARQAFFDILTDLSFALGGPPKIDWPLPERVQAVTGMLPPIEDVGPPAITLPLLASGGLDAGVEILPLPASAAGLPGIALGAWARGTIPASFALRPTLVLEPQDSAGLAAGASVVLRPGQAPQARLGLTGTGGGPIVAPRVGARVRYSRGRPLLLLDLGPIGHFQADAVVAGGGIASTPTGAVPEVEAGVEGGKLVIAAVDRDSFLATLLPDGPMELGLDLDLAWTHGRGIALRGGGGLSRTLPLHTQLGPLRLDTLNLVGTLGGDGLSLEASLTGGGSLGPFEATVDRLGATVTVAFHNGNLGPLDLSFAPKPPTGLGMSVDAGPIKGGGYLSFDPKAGEYGGVLDLSLQDIVQIKAIGLLSTHVPGGGFSLLLILTAEFPPIQLGFGFTLTGVGGLAGVHRTIAVEQLRAGLRNHALDSIMFPPDPLHDAPRILNDIRTYFPPAHGRYVFGPMLQLGWGTPTIVSAELGLLLELPDPIRLVLLGQLGAALPSEDVPLVQLHLDVLGVLDTAAKTLSIDGTLHDSSVLVYSIWGDMAFRLNWGDSPSFAMSLGGLHPRFPPPPGFPELRRLTVSLGVGDDPRLSCESYMALTSNSVQFGARVELYASAAGFSVHGYLGYDVLIIISPFSFEAGMEAGVDLKRGSSTLMSIALSFTLSGPTPWRARGTASFKILFLRISFDFDVSWGDDQQATLPAADARGPLVEAIRDPRNWTASLPDGAEHAVSLAEVTNVEGVAVVHPLGRLSLRQRVAPLDVTLTRFGSAVPDKWNRFEITHVHVNANPTSREAVQERFARAQFLEMSDDDKLSKPSFELMHAGARIGVESSKQGHVSRLDVHYETTIVDKPWLPPRRLVGLFRPDALVFAAHITTGAAALSQVLTTGDKKFVARGFEQGIEARDVAHVIASTDDLTLRDDLLATATTQVEAEQALALHLAANPGDAANLQVLPEHEAVSA